MGVKRPRPCAYDENNGTWKTEVYWAKLEDEINCHPVCNVPPTNLAEGLCSNVCRSKVSKEASEWLDWRLVYFVSDSTLKPV